MACPECLFTLAASIGSLKGPRHGGANLKVQNMMRDIKLHISNWSDTDQITAYLQKILDKKAFDKSGLIYGMGHAVYTLSDSREVVLKAYAKALAEEKGLTAEFEFYEKIEKIAGELIMEKRIPEELFTPIFAIARIPGWCAHRLEELLNGNRIIRPAYKYVGQHVECSGILERI